MKSLKLSIASLFMILLMSVPAFGGQWMTGPAGWWYQNTDGSYLKSGWYWIDGRCYYFNSSGYILTDTSAPDGSLVNGDGAWVSDGTAVTRPTEITLSTITARIPNGYYATVSDDGMSITLDQANPTSSGAVLLMIIQEESLGTIRTYLGDQGLKDLSDQLAASFMQGIDGSVSALLEQDTKNFSNGAWFYNLYQVTIDGQSVDVRIYIQYVGDEARIITVMEENREFTPDQFVNEYIR